jgi:hypothetical protein
MLTEQPKGHYETNISKEKETNTQTRLICLDCMLILQYDGKLLTDVSENSVQLQPKPHDRQDQKYNLLFPIVLGSDRLNINSHIYQDDGVFLHIGIIYTILCLSENI